MCWIAYTGPTWGLSRGTSRPWGISLAGKLLKYLDFNFLYIALDALVFPVKDSFLFEKCNYFRYSKMCRIVVCLNNNRWNHHFVPDSFICQKKGRCFLFIWHYVSLDQCLSFRNNIMMIWYITSPLLSVHVFILSISFFSCNLDILEVDKVCFSKYFYNLLFWI